MSARIAERGERNRERERESEREKREREINTLIEDVTEHGSFHIVRKSLYSPHTSM